ncbi:MAG: response regulator [bacterium]|nr:response regulator [bacterium]MDT8366105.1 response regulator [bacterium]
MSGVQLSGEVKKLDEHALVIIITSHASLDNAVATVKAGAFDYIFKPFQDLETVTEVVNRGMHKIALLHEKRGLMEHLEQNNLKMEESNQELKELVIRDGLTGLFNHRRFKEVLDREVARAARYERSL